MGTGRGYERRGDPFTLRVRQGEGPPTVRAWAHRGTGRAYFTRVLTSDCSRLDAVKVAGAVREYAWQLTARRGHPVDAEQLAQGLAFDWQPQAGTVTVRLAEQPKELRAEVRVRVEATATGAAGARGVRYWLTCPSCARRCGVLYASRWGDRGAYLAQPLTGCRTCLGLTDESRQRHKTLDWASARLGQRAYRGGRLPWYQGRSMVSHMRAHDVMMRAYGRVFKGMGVPMPGEE